MLKIKILNKKRENLELQLVDNEDNRKKLTERMTELEEKIERASTDDEVNEVEEEITETETKIEELEKEKEELQSKIDEVDKQIEELKRKNNNIDFKGEKRMGKEEKEKKIAEQREIAEKYIRSRGEMRENKITTSEIGVLIPKEIVTTPTKVKKKVIDLSEYVTVAKVTKQTGTYPLVKSTDAILVSTEELAKNPELAKPEFNNVDWSLKTYRGAIPISQESIDDAEVDVLAIVENHAERVKINTRNKEICNVLKTFTPKTYTKLDEVITLLDVDLEIAYSRYAIMTQSFFNKLHIIKDKMGRYMWDEKIISNSQNEYIPVEIAIVPDTYLGNKGESKAFIGDSEEGVFLADRVDLGVRWIEHEIYGQYLQAVTRFDVRKADASAGFFVEYNPTEA